MPEYDTDNLSLTGADVCLVGCEDQRRPSPHGLSAIWARLHECPYSQGRVFLNLIVACVSARQSKAQALGVAESERLAQYLRAKRFLE